MGLFTIFVVVFPILLTIYVSLTDQDYGGDGQGGTNGPFGFWFSCQMPLLYLWLIVAIIVTFTSSSNS